MNITVRFIVIAAAFFSAAVHAQTQAQSQAQVSVEQAWVRATVPQQRATGAFMQLRAPASTTLVGASSPAAGIVEIHEMAMQDNVMRMRQVPAIALPAGKTVELKPGGFHVMLLDLKQQVKAGDSVALTLVFQDASGRRLTREVKADVRALNAVAAPAAGDAHRAH